jgi:hypothetical protein
MIKSILQKLGLRKAEETPEVVSIEVSEEVLRQKMAEPKDFRMRITPTGELSAFCKACDTDLYIARDEMLVWFHCKACNRYSFNPPDNVIRDATFAQREAKPFEYEAYFIDFPPQLQPPSAFDAIILTIDLP